MIGVGEKALLFKGGSTKGEVDLAAFTALGPAVVYFFPKANTPG
jgi:peroxiredoxin